MFFYPLSDVSPAHVRYAPLATRALTSAVGQSVHGVAFVAAALKTTGVVHTGVIAGPLEEALVYVCNQKPLANQRIIHRNASFCCFSACIFPTGGRLRLVTQDNHTLTLVTLQ